MLERPAVSEPCDVDLCASDHFFAELRKLDATLADKLTYVAYICADVEATRLPRFFVIAGSRNVGLSGTKELVPGGLYRSAMEASQHLKAPPQTLGAQAGQAHSQRIAPCLVPLHVVVQQCCCSPQGFSGLC